MIKGKDYIGVGVGGLVVDGEGKVFLSQRGPKAKNERGTWEFPGGGVEFGEMLEETIVREFEEEYGMTIEVVELLTVFDHILPDEGQHWVSPTFICRHLAGEPEIKEPEKCSAIGWFTVDDMPSPLSLISQHDIEMYRLHIIR